MNIFEYIVVNRPNEAYQICEKYGLYNVDESQLAEAIAEIVSYEGETAFKELLDLHPDKEIILEIYQPQYEQMVRPLQYDEVIKVEETKELPKQEIVEFYTNPLSQKYFNAEGEGKIVNQTNFFILAGALIVSLAIISNRK